MEPIDALAAATLPLDHDRDGQSGSSAVETRAFFVNDAGGDQLIAIAGPACARPDEFSNRCLDVFAASMLLLLTLPLMAFCAIAVLVSGPGPLLFRQLRLGLNGEEFYCLKFRTMVPGGESALQRLLEQDTAARAEWLAVQKLQNDPRVTPIGRFLRRYCLDELPQLFNVLVGDMSIVGPRPIVSDEILRYGPKFADYCTVKPGITGLWQVSGRHKLTYEQRVQLDCDYARNKSTRTDLVILWKTVPVVLLGMNQ